MPAVGAVQAMVWVIDWPAERFWPAKNCWPTLVLFASYTSISMVPFWTEPEASEMVVVMLAGEAPLTVVVWLKTGGVVLTGLPTVTVAALLAQKRSEDQPVANTPTATR